MDADASDRLLSVDPLSLSSLRLMVLCGNRLLGTATGFLVTFEKRHFIITNWHVVTGRNAETGRCIDTMAAVPDRLAIDYHWRLFGRWCRVIEPLFDADRPLWLEHPHGCGHPKGVDVVALRVNPTNGFVRALPVFEETQYEAHVHVAAPVHVIGFPAGHGTAGQWPIWLTGHIATDPQLDFDRLPRFLIDVRTRGGMSGSPVVIRTNLYEDLAEFRKTRRMSVLSVPPGQPPLTKFLGVYSGRIRKDLDLGFVWRPHVLREIIEQRLDETITPGRFNAGVEGDDQPVMGASVPFDSAPPSVIDFDAPPPTPQED